LEFSSPTDPLVLRSDKTRVAAIVDQLLDNAVKYSPEGGAIVCTLDLSDTRAMLTVRDHGLGIAGEDLEQVFTRFGRLVTRENSHIPGAGLGLYLARESARRMGGDITVSSRPGTGSAFTLSLPLDGVTSAGQARV
jgi:signal transduction histidine kinase